LRGTWSSYFLNTDGVILVVDSTDRERAPIVRAELGKLLLNEELKQACILVFANKQDLREAMTAAEISEHLQLHAIRTHEVCMSESGVLVRARIRLTATHFSWRRRCVVLPCESQW
jgi:signal recognition particle receptor subunit beta